MHGTTNIIKDTLHRKTKCELPNQFFTGNRAVTNQDEIANEFNEYFVNIGRLFVFPKYIICNFNAVKNDLAVIHRIYSTHCPPCTVCLKMIFNKIF